MNKYLKAFLACLGIFILWILFQVYIAGGLIIGIIFGSAIFGVWKMIVNNDDKNDNIY